MDRKTGVLLIMAVTLLIIGAGIGAAAVLYHQKLYEGSVVVVGSGATNTTTGDANFEIWAIDAPNKELESLSFGSAFPGETAVIIFDFVNMGSVPLRNAKVEVICEVNIAGYSIYQDAIQPGDSVRLAASLKIADKTPQGTYPVTVVITAEE